MPDEQVIENVRRRSHNARENVRRKETQIG